MKCVSSFVMFLCWSLAVTTCFAETNKMKNEPKTVGGMECGDTPFNRFSLDEYLGRSEILGCPKVYSKNGSRYFFNHNDKLYQVETGCKHTDIQTFTNNYGNQYSVNKSENAIYENQTLEWQGNNINITMISTKINENKSIYNYCTALYQCNNIVNSEYGSCNIADINRQKDNVDIIIKYIGVDLSKKVSEYDAKNIEILIDNVKGKSIRIGLPEPKSVNISHDKGVLSSVCLLYETIDYGRVKKFFFNNVGDIFIDLDNHSYIGNNSFISMSKNHKVEGSKSIMFSVCLSNPPECGVCK